MPASGADDDEGLRRAIELYAETLAGPSLRVAAHRLVAALAAGERFDRAAIGLVQPDGTLRLVAVSDLPAEERAADWPQRLEGAMQEAIEQAVTLAVPPAGIADAPAADRDGAAACADILLEHRALAAATGAAAATVPLGERGEPIAAVTVQRRDRPFAAGELAQLEQVLMLAAPLLALQRKAEERWSQRIVQTFARWREDLRRPGHRSRRHALGAALLALAVLTLLPLPERIGGRARIEGAQQLAVAAPADGFVARVHARPGDHVAAGAPLIDLAEAELQLERERWASQLAQHQNAYAAAMAHSDRTEAAVSLARTDEAEAQLALIDARIERSRLRAPFDGLVIEGDLSRSIGAPVREGDALLTLARTGSYRVIVEVDEFDIGRVRPGQRGTLALSAWPWQGRAIVVERITPLARAADGGNVFEVQARLTESPDPAWRPGLVGRAALSAGRLPLLWSWLRRPADRLALVLWRWAG